MVLFATNIYPHNFQLQLSFSKKKMSSKIITLDLPHYILLRVLPLAKSVQLKYMHNLVNYTQVWANKHCLLSTIRGQVCTVHMSVSMCIYGIGS